jgi:3-phosphoshikimate 1-carboxyvinyltransferase
LKTLKSGGGIINCGESASTLRFLTPVAAALRLNVTFTGEGRLLERPDIYPEILKNNGVNLEPGKFYVPGDISSQFVTGLLFAFPLLDGDSEIILTSPLESEAYVDMTIDVLSAFGVNVDKNKAGYLVKGGQKYKSTNYEIEGDYSQAAFFACAAVINGDIKICGLSAGTLQGDYKIIEILREFGAAVSFYGDVLHVKKCENLQGIKIDGSQIPDIVPVLAVVAAYARGESVIYNAGRLRLKESDRIRAIYEMLNSIGVDLREMDDGLVINGGRKLRGGYVRSYSDHRIAMSAAISAVGTADGVTIDDMTCTDKSYPGFLRDFNNLIMTLSKP